MGLVEDVVEDEAVVAIAPGEAGPETGSIWVGQGWNELASAAEGGIRIQPLEIEEGVGAAGGGPVDYAVEVMKVLAGGATAAAVESPILIERDADDIAVPFANDVADLIPGETGGGGESILVGLGVLEAGAVDAAQQYGSARGSVDDAISGCREWHVELE
jgi:hypothetical protein